MHQVTMRHQLAIACVVLGSVWAPSAMAQQIPGLAGGMSRPGAESALPALGRETLPDPAEGKPVIDVRVEGNRTVGVDAILAQIRTRQGRAYDPQLVSSDVRRLLSTQWFLHVEPFLQRTPQGNVVVFKVVERPVVRYVQYLGNKEIKDKTLTKETNLKKGETLDPYRVEQGRQRIEDFYRSKGFNLARVTAFDGLKPDDPGITYIIHEGPQQKIWKVEFVGNQSGFASDGRLKTKVQSKKPLLWVFRGYVDREKIDNDIARLTDYYRSFGFFQAKVSRKLKFNEQNNWLTLQFVIHEGPRFNVRDVRFLGNQQFATEDLLERIQLQPGLPFERNKLLADRTWISDVYGSQGYVYADIQADIQFSENPGELDLVYKVTEGEKRRVGQIFVHINGDNPHTKITTALNHLTLAPGDVLDTREIRASERRLSASSLFNVNPTQGAPPRISFEIPELDKRAPSASQRQFRGQSPGQDAVKMHMHFENSQHYEQWVELAAQAEAKQSQSVPAQPTVARSAPSGDQVTRQRPVHAAYSHLLNEAVEPAQRQEIGTPPSAPPEKVAAPREPNEPRLIFRGQTPPWDNPVRYGGSAVGATGPATRPTERVAQSNTVSPAFQPPRALSPSTPGTLPPRGEDFMPNPAVPVTPITSPFNDPLANVHIDLSETQTGRFMAGVAVNSNAGLVGSIVIDERNFDWRRIPRNWAELPYAFRGGGQRFRMEAAPGSEVQRYLINWQDPFWRGTPFSLGLSGSYYDRRYRDWDEQRLGGRVSWGYQWPRRDLQVNLAYRGENVNIHDAVQPSPPQLQEVIGDNALHGFRLAITNDTRDSSFLATSGHYLEASIEQVIGTFDYPRAIFDARKYFLLRERADHSGRHVLSLSTRLGFTGENTPIYEHFFAGGYNTLRGFDFRGASPIVGGVEVGGEFMWINTVEYLMPVTADDMLHAVAFVDFGTVEPNVTINDFRVAPGLGLRITVPAMGPAPIALDFAWPIEHADTDDREVFSFHVGFLR